MRSSQNVDEENVKEWLQQDKCEIRQSQTLFDAVAKQNCEEQKNQDENEAGSSDSVSHCMAVQCVDTLIGCMGQTGFKYRHITATRNMDTAVWRGLNSSQKQGTITN
jgi:hypothetical protein